MWQNVKNYLQQISDFKIALLATILPICLMIFWQHNNSGLPLGDAGDFIGTSGAIANLFHTGNFFEGVYKLFTEKPWRPVSFHLILFPFMLVSKNNILFTAACVHILCLSLIIIYAFLILRILTNCKMTCFFGAVSVGLLSASFFPGGSFLFAEVGLTPAILAIIYHLFSSNYMTIKRHSYYTLLALVIAFTLRPVEATLHLIPVLTLFFYFGYKRNIFSKNLIVSILKIIFVTLLLLSFRGLDFEADHRFISADEKNEAATLYMNLFYFLCLFLLIIFSSVIASKVKKFYFYIKNSANESNTYAVIVFSLFSLIIFLWLYNSWRELFTWVYRTQFGDIAAATNSNSNFIDMPNSTWDIFRRFYYQIESAGLIPFITIFFFVTMSFIYKFINKLKIEKDILLYLLFATIFPVIPVLFTISSTSRRFALVYILLILAGTLFVSSFKNIRRYFSLMLILLISIQAVSIYSISNSNPIKYSQYISGDFKVPRHDATEKEIIDLIYKNSKEYDFKNIDLAFLYKDIESDIFTASLVNNLIVDKSYETTLPVIFHKYSREWLTERIKEVHGIFIINPEGPMDISDKYADKFRVDSEETDIIQDKLIGDLLYLYFSNKLVTEFNYTNIECITLKTKTKITEGCLLINSNHVKKINEN